MKTKHLAAAAAMLIATPIWADTDTESAINAPDPQPASPTIDKKLAWELGMSYNFATKNIVSSPHYAGKKLNMLGFDATAVFLLDEANAATLRFGYAWGAASGSMQSPGISWNDRYRGNLFSIMPGYRFVDKVDDELSWYAGLNLGVVNSSLKLRETGTVTGLGSYENHYHGSEWGFGYSVELGASYSLKENMALILAYEFSGNTARPKFSDGHGATVNSTQQVHHGVRVGVSLSY